MKIKIEAHKAGQSTTTVDREFYISSTSNETQMLHLGIIIAEIFLEHRSDSVTMRRVEEK